ncbi:MAG TPA: DNA phosphorothioation-associated protein 4 [Candidatus Poseidoniales archaeon]|nr:MAG TPA: DNA phosphorothioation-associated protein 4 [Candidatus Poseidoniales archaeon]HII62668.1 DNA phosphorothioation-associated protein 4 [Candidatus Poseidoniaceae archaeon]|tara:strand:- start:4603 stop:5040 length:438 start_codon:yes stop_codon:yes gene_type:complete
MPERRIRVPADKVDFIESMLKTAKGPFELKAQVLGFAAAYGSKYGERLPFSKTGEPIRHSVFVGEKLDTLINLLTITHTGDPKVLARSDEMEDLRATIFEEFANSGLALLENKLKGEVKYTQSLLLMMKNNQTTGDDVESLVGIF